MPKATGRAQAFVANCVGFIARERLRIVTAHRDVARKPRSAAENQRLGALSAAQGGFFPVLGFADFISESAHPGFRSRARRGKILSLGQ
jgi:hypothetical protein